jgi:hypothetical protein
MRQLLLIGLLLSNIVWARYIALLTETASGGYINSQKDIVTMKEILGDRYEFIVLNKPEATSVNIRNKLKELAKNLTPSDTFVFFYSGHGDRFHRGDNHEADHHDDFLVTSDIVCSSTDATNVLVDDELNYLYSKIRAKKIIIIDACHSSDMQKGVIENSVKRFKGCKNGFVTRGFDIDPSWSKAKNKNFLHFGAAQEKESALGSPDGGRFTLALAKVIKEQGNISFAKLEKEVQRELEPYKFHPSISSYSTIDKNQLYTKDIFVVPTTTPPKQRSLRAVLESRPNTIEVITQKGLDEYTIGRDITIKGYPSSIQNIYLIELKGDNDFRLIASKPQCIYDKKMNRNMCQFRKLTVTEPIGVSTIYMIQTSKPLDLGGSKDMVITSEFFDLKNSLVEQLNGVDFEVGRVKIKTVL